LLLESVEYVEDVDLGVHQAGELPAESCQLGVGHPGLFSGHCAYLLMCKQFRNSKEFRVQTANIV